MKIGFLGLGKLGLSCALAIKSKGHDVVGYDPNPIVQEYIRNKKIPYKEERVNQDFINFGFPEGSVIIDPWRYMPDMKNVNVIRLGSNQSKVS